MTWQLSTIPGMPVNAQDALNGMALCAGKFEKPTFVDLAGRGVIVPETKDGKPIIPIGYAKALWDLEHGDLLLGEEGTDIADRIFRRDPDLSGRCQRMDSWHEVASLANEYAVRPAHASKAWDTQMRVECAKKTARVLHGVKFADRAFHREDQGSPIEVLTDQKELAKPYELMVKDPFDESLAREGITWCRWVTVDDHSADNLARLFATPLLEPYKHLTYVLYGAGGNGKSLLLDSLIGSFPTLAVAINVDRLTGRDGSGFTQENETLSMAGKLWAFDEDANMVTLDQLQMLKRISTGDRLAGRAIGQNTVSFRPRATLAIATNNPVITSMDFSSARRFTFVRMRDGRKPAEFTGLKAWLAKEGALGLLMASCLLWVERGSNPWQDVSIGSISDLEPEEQEMVDDIVAGEWTRAEKYARMSHWQVHNSLAKLGLKSVLRREGSRVFRVYVVSDERRFAPYRQQTIEQNEEADDQYRKERGRK